MISSYWIEVKYANMLSVRLNRYKLKSTNPYLANFRCFACGDSAHSKIKARGYIYEDKGHLKVKCHNCEYHGLFGKLISDVDPMLAAEYRLECVKENGNFERKSEPYVPDIAKFNKPRFQHYEPMKALKKVSQLKTDHPAAVYVRNRKIPSNYHFRLFYAPKFNAWVNTLIPDKMDEQQLLYDEPRLVIPFIDENGYVFGFQGRSFKKNSSLRYMTIMLDENKPKVYGLDKIDFTLDHFIFEGPIDSMFVFNSLALAGSDGNILSVLGKDNSTLVYDNEPRNAAICKKIERAIDNNFRVVIFPKSVEKLEKYKDINDLILSGMSQDEVRELLYTNSYRGLAAKLKFREWKKVTT